jgi:putative transcriptional regulator
MKKTKKKTSAIGQKLIESLNDALKFESGEKKDLRTQLIELPPEPRKFLAKEVARLRADHGLSQVHFARVLGVSPGAVRSWEQGQKPMSGAASRVLEILELDPKIFSKLAKLKTG